MSGQAAVMEVTPARPITTLQPINVLGSHYFHGKCPIAATLTLLKPHCTVIR